MKKRKSKQDVVEQTTAVVKPTMPADKWITGQMNGLFFVFCVDSEEKLMHSFGPFLDAQGAEELLLYLDTRGHH